MSKGPTMFRLIPVLLLLAAVAATGCGSEGDTAAGIASLDDAASPGVEAAGSGEDLDSEEAMLALTQCLRDQGLEVSDPEVDDDGNLRLGSLLRAAREAGDLDREEVRTAMEECSEYVEAVRTRFEEVDRSEIEDRLYEYAACMRDNGYEMPDPDFGGGSGGEPGGGPGPGGGPFTGLDPDDAGFQAANEACLEVFGGDLPLPGPGGPGGGPGGRDVPPGGDG